MDKFLIRGGKPLQGKISVSGAKNSALPCLAATLLTAETVTLHNVPYVKDLITQRRLLEDLGATVLTPELHNNIVTAKNIGGLKRLTNSSKLCGRAFWLSDHCLRVSVRQR